MTREEFKKKLEDKEYSYIEQSDNIIVTHDGDVWLGEPTVKTIPPGVEFRNRGYVSLNFVETLPSDTLFRNDGYVALDFLQSIPSGVKFVNRGLVWIDSIIGVKPFRSWKGNIKGIDDERLLNKMISIGLFNRK